MTLAAAIEGLEGILHFPELVGDLGEGLDLIRPGGAEQELGAWIACVEGRFESSPNYAVVLQFLQDHSRLTDQQLVQLFEFIYSKLVNKFKGEIGEVLAARTIFDFPRFLGEDLEVVHGSWISARQIRGRGGWYDAADALYCRREGSALEVVAIAEVKSKRTPFNDLRTQVAKNILRLRHGLCLRGQQLPAEQIRVRTADGWAVAATSLDENIARSVTSLLILPWKKAVDGTPTRHPVDRHVWLAELPHSQGTITEAAYRFMSWYFSRIGPKVFYSLGDATPPEGDRHIPAPHPEDSLEENGSNAFMEAIYHAGLRSGFDARKVAPQGRRTAWQTLLWLYNSLGFGYEHATADELIFPEVTPDPRHQAWLERHNAAMAEWFAHDLGSFAMPATLRDRQDHRPRPSALPTANRDSAREWETCWARRPTRLRTVRREAAIRLPEPIHQELAGRPAPRVRAGQTEVREDQQHPVR